MPARKQSKGMCLYCGKEATKAAITKHLPACPQRQAAIATAEQKKEALSTSITCGYKMPTTAHFG